MRQVELARPAGIKNGRRVNHRLAEMLGGCVMSHTTGEFLECDDDRGSPAEPHGNARRSVRLFIDLGDDEMPLRGIAVMIGQGGGLDVNGSGGVDNSGRRGTR